MFHVVLYQPEIPPNTGNVIRLCANCGARLHLIRPLGFELSDKQLRRAGLDYHEFVNVQEYDSLEAFVNQVRPGRLLACSTKGRQHYGEVSFRPDDALLFGPETRGLPAEVLAALPTEQVLRIPMLPDNRSLNLSNAVAIVVYEAWRQQGFTGGV
jgi:tRNA (cytidine/uridine-2'-O-)-methyltransferase